MKSLFMKGFYRVWIRIQIFVITMVNNDIKWKFGLLWNDTIALYGNHSFGCVLMPIIPDSKSLPTTMWVFTGSVFEYMGGRVREWTLIVSLQIKWILFLIFRRVLVTAYDDKIQRWHWLAWWKMFSYFIRMR